MIDRHHESDGRPTRTWCGKAEYHEAHRWFAAEHRLTPMRCRGSLGSAAASFSIVAGRDE